MRLHEKLDCIHYKLIAQTNDIHCSMNTLYRRHTKPISVLNEPGYLRTAAGVSSSDDGEFSTSSHHLFQNFWKALFMRSTSFYMSIAYEYSNILRYSILGNL